MRLPFGVVPIYEYRCRNGHTFDVFQRISDDAVTTCEECGAPVERLFHPVAVHFKGSGFYSTDYRAKAKAGASEDGGATTESGEKGGTDKDKGTEKAKGSSKPGPGG